MLTDAQVHRIRTSGETDAHLARKYRVRPETIRRARTGLSHLLHPTPPDTAPREGAGRRASPQARPARLRRSYFA
jgi:hypothetical protein